MIPFRAGINWGCQLIMTAHISLPNVSGADMPSTLSSYILQDKLRKEMGYKNVIVADAMEMGAITQQYNNVEATLLGIQAGLDIILNPYNLVEAFDAVVDAVNKGTISEARIDESVRRILKLKQSLRQPTSKE
jgi:beta-N-acetylhexosaminidase